jgi:hypothetical protein
MAEKGRFNQKVQELYKFNGQQRLVAPSYLLRDQSRSLKYLIHSNPLCQKRGTCMVNKLKRFRGSKPCIEHEESFEGRHPPSAFIEPGFHFYMSSLFFFYVKLLILTFCPYFRFPFQAHDQMCRSSSLSPTIRTELR